jgi:hypothetical protein
MQQRIAVRFRHEYVLTRPSGVYVAL